MEISVLIYEVWTNTLTILGIEMRKLSSGNEDKGNYLLFTL